VKKIPILLVLFALAQTFAVAQVIRASPLEGRWALDEQEDTETVFTELIFFGNIILFMYYETPTIYYGGNFTHTGNTLAVPFDIVDSVAWQGKIPNPPHGRGRGRID